ncbi:ferrochelatase [Nitrincola sp. A-D6]|uniref:ferrochelatase n=1 Tax=Nitrincola sp. A-D6 TaxID=1545442 RepID=UPI00051FA9EA|nr:ferrochelatase [Nitrincola sp. A-D6]KGK41906.1 ferrochelatase [Nitrincola sp. A-D6]
MRFNGVKDFDHSQSDKIGVLITNLGTPDEPTTPALRRYLKEFLSDPRVVEVPRPIWWFILNGVILNIRPAKSAAAYREVWTDAGSPLLTHTQDQCAALKKYFSDRYGDRVQVEFAMRYGNPSITSVLEKLQQAGVRKLVVLPLYPQYSGATSASTFDAIAADFTQRRWLPDLNFISHYPDFEPYITALADKVRHFQAEHGVPDKLILSYHGVPKRYLLQGDPYHCECHKTSRLLAEQLGLQPDQYLTTFQSRFGREEWLKPYTDETLKSLPAKGVKSVQVFCPGFSSDCLETIEEIGQENREYFIESGGESYAYIPALNADASHIDMMVQLLEPHLHNWLVDDERDGEQTQALAKALGALR